MIEFDGERDTYDDKKKKKVRRRRRRIAQSVGSPETDNNGLNYVDGDMFMDDMAKRRGSRVIERKKSVHGVRM
jgi:hypothetical protein